MSRRRLDAELARRGLARSREHAQGLIASGSVVVRGVRATKPATWVDDADSIAVSEQSDGYVSRGAYKLAGALDRFTGLGVARRVALDVGASTGGFTQVLLERGAACVLAVDVGYGQIAWSLRQDDRVILLERTNARYLEPAALARIPGLVVADLSFISLVTVLPALIDCSGPNADLLLMVKPQFEVGRERVGDGVVRDPALRADSVRRVAVDAMARGLHVHGIVASSLPGPSGNIEYFVWLAKGLAHHDEAELCLSGDPAAVADGLDQAIDAAVREGPQ